MMDLKVNDVKIEKKEDLQEKTLNEILDIILQDCDDDSVVTSLEVDGSTIDEKSEERVLNTKAQNFQSINFFIKTRLNLAFEALDSASTYIDNIIERINSISNHYRENNFAQASAEFADSIEIIDLFIQLMANVQATLKSKVDLDVPTYKNIQNLEIHLLSVLKSLIPAKEKKDIIMLCDLLEYELIDNLTQWKIKVIPELKKLKSN